MSNAVIVVLALAGVLTLLALAGWSYTLTRLTAFLTPALNVRREATRLADEIDARVSRRIAMINEREEEDPLGLPLLPGFTSSMLEQPGADDATTARLRREIEQMTMGNRVPEGREKEPFMAEV